ncbi:hypothetical protein SAMN05880590_11437 [Rhizobium sp. RU35A]|uniref:Uncharacterized protein n=1 Tax=Rhizobium straminoryzae TaxID=1387186 RepID=A0A549SVB4_9HYPH|nr:MULTISPECIES: hypothetical protein [Rhizobium]TRL33498.1 hypothetical protein FNA46_22985 [Rhizobium straminoryzae]SIR21659.1 hypothetical protein SAMN05880590_11437 [Rhizobium sp. RU35A]
MSFSSYDALEASDLSLLRKVLEEVCRERAIALDSEEASSMARALIDWYLFGIRHPQQLKDMLDPLPLTHPSP